MPSVVPQKTCTFVNVSPIYPQHVVCLSSSILHPSSILSTSSSYPLKSIYPLYILHLSSITPSIPIYSPTGSVYPQYILHLSWMYSPSVLNTSFICPVTARLSFIYLHFKISKYLGQDALKHRLRGRKVHLTQHFQDKNLFQNSKGKCMLHLSSNNQSILRLSSLHPIPLQPV